MPERRTGSIFRSLGRENQIDGCWSAPPKGRLNETCESAHGGRLGIEKPKSDLTRPKYSPNYTILMQTCKEFQVTVTVDMGRDVAIMYMDYI